MYQNIYNYFFEYDLSKTPGFTYVLANFLGVIIYTAFNPRRRKNIWAYAELLILGLMYLVYNFFTRDISTVLQCAHIHSENLQGHLDGSLYVMYLRIEEFPTPLPFNV